MSRDGRIYELNINITIRSNFGDNLQVSETVSIQAADFLDMAKVLGQFHDLAVAMKIQSAEEKRGR